MGLIFPNQKTENSALRKAQSCSNAGKSVNGNSKAEHKARRRGQEQEELSFLFNRGQTLEAC